MADITKINVNGTEYDIKDANAITTESDPTVPSWAKQSTKPTYEASEIDYDDSVSQLGNNVQEAIEELEYITSSKQNTLVSGSNIKTVNNESLLGSGNITIEGGSGTVIYDGDSTTDTPYDNLFMDTVQSGIGTLIGGGVDFIQEWENRSMSSNYSAHTETLDLSSYNFVVIVFLAMITTTLRYSTHIFPVNNQISLCMCSGSFSANRIATRATTVNTTGVAFGDCYYSETYATTTQRNDMLVPYKIYGIKSATVIDTKTNKLVLCQSVEKLYSSLAGNTDSTLTLTLPTGVTTDDLISIDFVGYVPGSTWGTTFMVKRINGTTLGYRTNGTTTQNYTLIYKVYYYGG